MIKDDARACFDGNGMSLAVSWTFRVHVGTLTALVMHPGGVGYESVMLAVMK